jgi:small subunit ribosomal protein S20
MANIASAIKRIRQNEKRRIRNRAYKTRLKTYIKKFLSSIENGDLKTVEGIYLNCVRIIDKTASKGIIHKKQAARRKSRLTSKLNKFKSKDKSPSE